MTARPSLDDLMKDLRDVLAERQALPEGGDILDLLERQIVIQAEINRRLET